MAMNAGRDGVGREGAGPDEPADSLGAGSAPAFSEEGMRRIVYAQDRDRSAFGEDTAELEADLQARRKVVPVVIALAALVSFGAIVWYAYSWGTGQMAEDQLPVVQAEIEPEKTRPEQSGGMEVPHQDKLVLNDGEPAGGTPRVESLLPPPETPQALEPLPDPATAPEPAVAETLPQEGQSASETSEAVAALPDSSEIPSIPEIPADPEAAEAEPVPGESGIALPQRKPAPPAAGVAPQEDQIARLLEQAPLETASGDASAPAASQTAAVQPSSGQGAGPGDIVLQLSSVKSEAAATREWARLQAAHPSLLGPLALALDTAEVQGSTYYRVQTGPFPSREAASEICDRLKSRNQDCLVKQR